MLHLHLLGSFSITRNGEPLTGFVSDKVRALLVYLAQTKQTHTRDALAALLWAEVPDSVAKHSLRQALSNLRKLAPEMLTVTRQTVGVNSAEFSTDVAQFHHHLNASQDALAAAHYTGDFLTGFTIADAPEFEAWQLIEREALHRQAFALFERLCQESHEQADLTAAIAYAQRLLTLEPWHEPTHRRLMRLQAQSGEFGAALQQFDQCQHALVAELGLEPTAETERLYGRIQRARTLSVPPLPAQPSPLVGRSAEIASVRRALQHSRLVTIHGAGGVGKTRLALAAAETVQRHYLEGVFFVPLAAVADFDGMLRALVRTLGIKLRGEQPVADQIQATLSNRETLLLLDNIEHLLDDAVAHFLSELLAAAPELHLLMTSRERLRLRWESVVPLDGLAYPSETAAPEAQFASAELFTQVAERVGIRPKPTDTSDIHHICRLVEGVPLALELAAAICAEQPIATIAQRLRATFDTLSSQFRDLPPRQRSLRATFDYSWALLTPTEQVVLAQLSIFRGGFDRAAVAAIVGSDDLLDQLAHKSLVQPQPNGRFALHEAVREFSAEKLPNPHGLAHKHASYFAQKTSQLGPSLNGVDGLVAASQFEQDNANIYASCQHALDHKHVDIALELFDGFSSFLELRGYFSEGVTLLERANGVLAQLPATNPQRNRALMQVDRQLGQMLERMGRNKEAEQRLHNALDLALRLESAQDIATVYLTLSRTLMNTDLSAARAQVEAGLAVAEAQSLTRHRAALLGQHALVLQSMGDVAAAIDSAEAGLAILEQLALPRPTAIARHSLAAMHLTHGDMGEAGRLLRTNLAQCVQLKDWHGEGQTRYYLISVCMAEGNLAEAHEHAARGYAMAEKAKDPRGMAMLATDAGRLLLRERNLAAAHERFSTAYGLCVGIQDVMGQAITKHGLAQVAMRAGELDSAEIHLQTGLRLLWDMQATPYVIDLIPTAAQIAIDRGNVPTAARYIATIRDHSACSNAAKGGIKRVEENTQLPAAKPSTLEKIVAELLD